MADFKQNYFQKRTKDRGPRSNNRISSPDVQVITSDGENLGVMNTNEAVSMAKNQGLDLIEIAAKANPPVCKIMDMGKFKYDAQKKANLAKKKQNLNYKIRDHSLAKIPLLLICGKKEVDSNSVTIRRLDSTKQENMDLKLFLKTFSALNKASSN